MRFSIYSECGKVRKSMWDYAGGGLSDSEREHIAAHIAVCDKCAQELAGYSAARNLVFSYRSVAQPESRLGWRDLERKLTAQPVKTPVWSMYGLRFGLGAGVLAATAAVLFLSGQSSRLPSHGTVASITPGQARVAVQDPFKDVEVSNGADSKERSVALTQESIHSPDVPGVKHSTPAISVAAASVRRSKAPRTTLAHGNKLAPTATEDDQDGARVAMNDYVLTSASNGSDEDQSRRYVIDLVASASTTEVAEEAHPW